MSGRPEPKDGSVGTPLLARLLDTKSVVAKFLIRLLAPLLTCILILLLAIGHFTRTDMMDGIDNDVEAFASSISRVVDGLMWNLQTEEMVSALGAISANSALLGAEIFTEKGKLFISYGITPEDRIPGLLTVTRDIYRRLPDGGRVEMGTLKVHYTHAFADKEFRSLFAMQTMMILGVIATILSIASFTFNRTVSRPLRKLLTAIHETGRTGAWTRVDWESDDEIGEVIHAHNAMLDLLGAKEEDLAESERRYRHLFDNALVGIYHVDADGIVTEANQTVAQLMGYSSMERAGRINARNHYARPKDMERLRAILTSQGEVFRFRTRLRRVDGSEFWAELSGRLNADGSFNGILQDVTDLVEARHALEERDELHRAFFEENKAVMLLHDPVDSSIQFVNPAACQFYGYTAEELTSMTIRQLDCMTDEEIYRELKLAAEEHRGYFKHLHTQKDGTRRHVEVFTGPISLGNRQLYYSIVHDVTEKRRLEAKLERMATRDQLTGAYNRHAFFQMSRREVERARRFGHPLALLMFDLDHFKQVNDTYGHATGDEVLRVFALRCRADLRQSDIFARLGGEEFAALLVETGAEQAEEAAERIRQLALAQPIPTESGPLIVTASIGIASLEGEESVADLLKRADMGLYEAKQAGRNTVRKA
ncbi:diguanylate cyclase [Pseudodesulfovibrio indicus]|uniref:PAS domain S-box-containing protein/diguanylate cyclase (GGDEF)-like protein n=1 Tax=Pseudodesulfovibrio indicus TaxID=1716143 RepID=A0A126QQY8_9BACT|nr:diguanylate cyclase [Pseudodesulfovibrio indicus]AMK12401.1 hypothetical protein AWY79_15485 [Pseudodesulfovibrio indicus]TDT90699.1 PAS domain S-box-containing protein/diguanylate cyclase (GGDEF)-like protein [Pseudodesulfovibrio indicus]